MLTFDLTKHGKTPLYEYLYQQIRQSIITGELAPGERLPSKRELARHLSVGVITVANAYELLLTEGYIRAEERRGFFVENVSLYRQKPAPKTQPAEEQSEEPEEEYFADEDIFSDEDLLYEEESLSEDEIFTEEEVSTEEESVSENE